MTTMTSPMTPCLEYCDSHTTYYSLFSMDTSHLDTTAMGYLDIALPNSQTL